MHYRVVVFGVKDTSENIISFIERELTKVDLVITIAPDVTKKNQVSGYKGLQFLTEKYGIPVFEADSYKLTDEKTQQFIRENSFGLGIVMGWQRLIPASVLDAFRYGIYGFHGNAGYLPFGRGRSPLNWSMIVGDTRFNLNLFRYDAGADSPNVFATEMFSINEHDDIRTAQYKNMICSKSLIRKLFRSYEEAEKRGETIPLRTESQDFDSWYTKRTPIDGKINWHDRTRNIYNLIRGVAAPFPGAFCYVTDAADENIPDRTADSTAGAAEGGEKRAVPGIRDALTAHTGKKSSAIGSALPGSADTNSCPDIPGDAAVKVTIWEAHPFDEMIDFSAYAPGEVVDCFDGKLIVRTVDGSMRIDRYECGREISVHDRLY